MKNKFCTLFAAFLLLGGLVKAQSTENWQPIELPAGGASNANGIEASYQLASSNGNDVVLVKLVNHTPHSVKASWKDLIVTKNGQNLSGNNNDEAVTISAKVKLSDDSGNTVQVTIKLSDFKTTAADFKSFNVSDFNVIANQ